MAGKVKRGMQLLFEGWVVRAEGEEGYCYFFLVKFGIVYAGCRRKERMIGCYCIFCAGSRIEADAYVN